MVGIGSHCQNDRPSARLASFVKRGDDSIDVIAKVEYRLAVRCRRRVGCVECRCDLVESRSSPMGQLHGMVLAGFLLRDFRELAKD